jgi:hypothetical protein
MILAALLWLPLIGSGMGGEYLLRSTAPEVVILIADRLDGERGCYVVIEPATATVWQYNQITGDWLGDGHYCRVTAKRTPAGAVRLSAEFRRFKGEKTIYVMERPGGQWYRAGTWTVRDEDVPQLPPADPLDELEWLRELFPTP